MLHFNFLENKLNKQREYNFRSCPGRALNQVREASFLFPTPPPPPPSAMNMKHLGREEQQGSVVSLVYVYLQHISWKANFSFSIL